jgi:hypothetical protein
MGKPAKLHEVQQLAGRVAALSRFVARLGEKALPFYALMKKSDKKFEWTEEADAAFSQLKKVLSTPPDKGIDNRAYQLSTPEAH